MKNYPKNDLVIICPWHTSDKILTMYISISVLWTLGSGSGSFSFSNYLLQLMIQYYQKNRIPKPVSIFLDISRPICKCKRIFIYLQRTEFFLEKQDGLIVHHNMYALNNESQPHLVEGRVQPKSFGWGSNTHIMKCFDVQNHYLCSKQSPPGTTY